ncbi:MAG: hypothetical protein IT445_20935 [Phycisphaeraceae bacterium]|nr:hypothetical protein [Phycisphaeraceae bacterium]
MRTFMIIGALMLLVAGSVASPYDRPRVYPQMLIEGLRAPEDIPEGVELPPTRWYSTQDLDEAVRLFMKEHKVKFDFQQTEPQFWCSRDRTDDVMVTGTYSNGIGQPYLSVRINWYGRVIDHEIGTAVCGFMVDRETQPKQQQPDN